MINLFQPNLGKEEMEAITEVFASNWLGKGTKVSEFETNFGLSLEENPALFLSTTSCTEAIFFIGKII